MEIKPITDHIAVSPQLRISDVESIKNHGFKSIICNRPNGEEIDQPSYQDIEQAAIEQGLQFVYLPITSIPVPIQAINEFKHQLKTLPSPVLAYCRTGTRSAMLWSLGELEERGLSEVLHKTSAAGYDLSDEIQAQVK